MKSYLKLLNFELNRFMKLYLLLMLFVGIVQTATVIFYSFTYMQLVKDASASSRMTPEKFIESYWKFSLAEVIYTNGFMIPIIIAVAGLVFYMFFIWYRDWFARNTFIFRLLMLPTDRMNIYFAKLTTIMLTVFGMLAFQIVMLLFYKQIVEWIVPLVYREDLSIGILISSSLYLNMFIPSSFSSFIVTYGLGFTAVVVVFTIILLERSYKWIGLIYGIIYASVALLIYALPVIIQFIVFNKFYLYLEELFWIEVAITILIVICSLVMSNYLLKKKVTV